jgi:hypothetical protein
VLVRPKRGSRRGSIARVRLKLGLRGVEIETYATIQLKPQRANGCTRPCHEQVSGANCSGTSPRQATATEITAASRTSRIRPIRNQIVRRIATSIPSVSPLAGGIGRF